MEQTEPKQTGLHIIHDAVRQCFECDVDGRRCVADYRLERRPGGGVMHMTHTGVPPALEGRGIAAALVAAALAHARDAGLKVNPLCSYVRVYLQRHPETRGMQA